MPRPPLDIDAHRQFALMTVLLAGGLVALYGHVLVLGTHAEAFLQSNGAVPSKLLALIQWRNPYRCLSAVEMIVASVFLHATWLHLSVNILFLLLFGPSVEDRLGHYRLLLLFVVSGAVAVLAQALATPESRLAFVGAQGAIAGVGGACLAISPRGRVLTMVRGLEFPWIWGPVAWLLAQILVAVAPLPMPADVAGVGLAYLLLAYLVGVALGPIYYRYRPVLLRG